MRVAVLGMGEAGRCYAADLVAAGHAVVAFDPADVSFPDRVERAESPARAASGAGLVVSLTGARFAEHAARQVTAAGAVACFADFNSADVATKRAVEDALPGTPVADVAVLAPVPRAGARTPLVVSGPGAGTVAEAFRPVGAAVEVLDAEVGATSATRLSPGCNGWPVTLPPPERVVVRARRPLLPGEDGRPGRPSARYHWWPKLLAIIGTG